MSSKDLSEEIEEILVDCYGPEEEMSAWEVAFQDRVEVPFRATLLGDPVEVHGFRTYPGDHVQCLVVKSGQQRWMGIEALDEDSLPPDCAHLVELYEGWQSGAD